MVEATCPGEEGAACPVIAAGGGGGGTWAVGGRQAAWPGAGDTLVVVKKNFSLDQCFPQVN